MRHGLGDHVTHRPGPGRRAPRPAGSPPRRHARSAPARPSAARPGASPPPGARTTTEARRVCGSSRRGSMLSTLAACSARRSAARDARRRCGDRRAAAAGSTPRRTRSAVGSPTLATLAPAATVSPGPGVTALDHAGYGRAQHQRPAGAAGEGARGLFGRRSRGSGRLDVGVAVQAGCAQALGAGIGRCRRRRIGLRLAQIKLAGGAELQGDDGLPGRHLVPAGASTAVTTASTGAVSECSASGLNSTAP